MFIEQFVSNIIYFSCVLLWFEVLDFINPPRQPVLNVAAALLSTLLAGLFP